MTTRSLQRMLFRALPAGVLVMAFAGICVQTGTLWPWHRVVHEDGVRTLLQTIFFFEHATRELLPDLLLAVAVAGAVRHFFPPGGAAPSGSSRRKRLGWLAAATLAVIIGGTVWTGGWHAVLDNLSQSHTRAGAPLVWGAHWRYHLIERLAQMLLAFAAVGAIWMYEGRPAPAPAARPRWFFGAALFAFAALTLVFDPTTEPFQDPAFLGHQLRELFTHTLVTLPLALGVCLDLAVTASSDPVSRPRQPVWPIVAAAAASVLCGVFLLAASLATGAQSHGQATGMAALLFPHFAEHALGYVLVPAVAGFLYLWPPRTHREEGK